MKYTLPFDFRCGLFGRFRSLNNENFYIILNNNKVYTTLDNILDIVDNENIIASKKLKLSGNDFNILRKYNIYLNRNKCNMAEYVQPNLAFDNITTVTKLSNNLLSYLSKRSLVFKRPNNNLLIKDLIDSNVKVSNLYYDDIRSFIFGFFYRDLYYYFIYTEADEILYYKIDKVPEYYDFDNKLIYNIFGLFA